MGKDRNTSTSHNRQVVCSMYIHNHTHDQNYFSFIKAYILKQTNGQDNLMQES